MVMPRSRSMSIGVEHLRLHLAVRQTAAEVDDPVGQGGFTVVDVGNDRSF